MTENVCALAGVVFIVIAVAGLVGLALGAAAGALVAVLMVGVALLLIARSLHRQPDPPRPPT